ncbi:MAG: polyprenyl synthetase family protein [Lachnospiraceae bacterium]|nr:polyprenyl synthetase family protein [Lachnospiraceae bacterium]
MFPLETYKSNMTELEQARFYFDLFLEKHRLSDGNNTAYDTLEGDYYFSQFSLHLIPVDSVEITESYAKELREKVSGAESPSLNMTFPEKLETFSKAKNQLEQRLSDICFSGNDGLSKDLMRVLLAGGKRLRPALSWAAYYLPEEGEKKAPILPLMLMIELMHSVSLIHDDVVDEGVLRRGVPTINASSGNLAAVKAGDFLLGRAMDLLKIYKGMGINERLAYVSEQMCLGELEQLENINKEITVDQYKRRIERKTAYFIEAAAACGAMAAGAEEATIKCLETYGYNMGMAFQIKDDILDITGDERLGKAVLQDKNRGLITLPQLLGVEKSEQEVKNYSLEAIAALDGLKENSAKKDLVRMAKLFAERES